MARLPAGVSNILFARVLARQDDLPPGKELDSPHWRAPPDVVADRIAQDLLPNPKLHRHAPRILDRHWIVDMVKMSAKVKEKDQGGVDKILAHCGPKEWPRVYASARLAKDPEKFDLGSVLGELSDQDRQALGTSHGGGFSATDELLAMRLTLLSDLGALRQAREEIAKALSTPGDTATVFGVTVHANAPAGGIARSRDNILRDLLDTVRKRLISLIADVFGKRLEELKQEGDPDAKRSEIARDSLPYLNEIDACAKALNRDDRYEYGGAEGEAKQATLLRVVQLRAAASAEGEIAAAGTPELEQRKAKARATANLPEKAKDPETGKMKPTDWCGAFAFTQEKEAGLNPELNKAQGFPGHMAPMSHNTAPADRGASWDAFFSYRWPAWVWTGAEWEPVKAYHERRHAERKFRRILKDPQALEKGSKDEVSGERHSGEIVSPEEADIQPGDIVLIDVTRKEFGDHITMAVTHMQGGAVTTIGGNQPDISKNRRDIANQPDIKAAGGSRVYAYGRFSIVDFETHHYVFVEPQDKTKPPSSAPKGP